MKKTGFKLGQKVATVITIIFLVLAVGFYFFSQIQKTNFSKKTFSKLQQDIERTNNASQKKILELGFWIKNINSLKPPSSLLGFSLNRSLANEESVSKELCDGYLQNLAGLVQMLKDIGFEIQEAGKPEDGISSLTFVGDFYSYESQILLEQIMSNVESQTNKFISEGCSKFYRMD
jgi:hypothetical protein